MWPSRCLFGLDGVVSMQVFDLSIVDSSRVGSLNRCVHSSLREVSIIEFGLGYMRKSTDQKDNKTHYHHSNTQSDSSTAHYSNSHNQSLHSSTRRPSTPSHSSSTCPVVPHAHISAAPRNRILDRDTATASSRSRRRTRRRQHMSSPRRGRLLKASPIEPWRLSIRDERLSRRKFTEED